MNFNMAKELPSIPYKSNVSFDYGIEILTIESLRDRLEDLDHNPERPHQLAFNMIVLYTSGSSKQMVDFVWHDIRENTLLYVSKGQANAFKFEEELRGYLMLFTDDYLKEQLNKLPRNEIVRLFTSHLFSPKIQIPESSNVGYYIDLFFKEFYKNSNVYNKRMICDSLYTIIFSKLEELKQFQTFHVKQSNKLELFLRFKNLVEANFTKSRNADFYASKLNITYKHLNSVCKDIVDITAKNFIDEFVVLEAKRRLINSSIKSNELAYRLGFNEPTNFVKYFKKFTGLTPNSFKKEYN